MEDEVTIKTSTRDQLVLIAHQLMQGIDENFLFREGKPLIVLVDGDFSSGKKIFPDESLSFFKTTYLFHTGKGAIHPLEKGKPNYDEYHTLISKTGIPFGLSFIIVDYVNNYSGLFQLPVTRDFLEGGQKKRNPLYDSFLRCVVSNEHVPSNGIVFIHNTRGFEQPYDFAIEVKNNGAKIIKGNEHWERVVSLAINPESDLAKSPQFQSALNQLRV